MRDKYIVLSPFRDLQDKSKKYPDGKIYAIGDFYSNNGVSQKRIDELSTNNNKTGRNLIELYKKDLKDYTVEGLKDLAREKELEGYSNLNKEKLIELIEGD